MVAVISVLFVFMMVTRRASAGPPGTGESLATAVPFEEAPTIDGKIAEGEWDRAVHTNLFVGWKRLPFEPRHAAGWMGFDKENLYIAVRSAARPTGLLANKKIDDGRLIQDSDIEIWIDPNRHNRRHGEGDLSYYQFIGNSIDTTKDVKFGPGSPDTGWDVTGEYKNYVDEEKGVWTAELSIPWTDLGWEKGAELGRSIGLVIARDFKSPWNQPTWMPLGEAFSSVGVYPEVRLTKDDPVVRLEQLQHDTFVGGPPLQMSVLNPSDEARKVKVHMLITSTDMPKIEEEKAFDVPAGEKVTFEHQIAEGRLHKRATHTLELVVTDADNDQVLFRHKGAQWKKPRRKLWNVRTGPNPQAAAKIGYYPSYKVLKVWLRPDELGEEFTDTRSATITVTDAAGEEILDEQYAWSAEKSVGLAEFTLPGVDEGLYTATIEIDGYGEPLVRHFEDKSFVWVDNHLGITTRIFPPFEPIQKEGNTLEVVMREYAMNGLGLWDSVQARGNETDFKELLAAPMGVQVSMESDALDAQGEKLEGDGEFTSTKAHEVVFEGRASHPAVNVESTTITEYDGCMRVEMDLLPGEQPEKIQSLWVNIPIKDELAPLYHASTTALRYNPAGRTPKGDGLFWDTRDFPDGEWPTGFRPYIWLGAEERGLCWFADNDENWVKDVDYEKGKYDPAFSLHRKDGVLTLRIHLVQRPVTLKRQRHIVFGVMATPAKPMPEDWRAIGRPDYHGMKFSMGHGYGLYGSYASKYPLNYDWARFDHTYAKRIGDKELQKRAKKRVDAWYERNVDERAQKIQKLNRLKGLDFSKRAPEDPYSVYFEEVNATLVKGGEELPAFYTEWSGRPLNEGYMFRDPPPVRLHASTSPVVKSYRDFACWYAAEWLRRGMGIYFDNTFPHQATDPLTTSAYRWRGRIVPSAGMWNYRKYMKRIWIMHQQMYNPDAPQAMMLHMTNTHIAPYMVWNEYNLDFEWRRSDKVLQKRFSPEIIRTETLGLKTGNVPVVLGFSGGPPMLVHEVKTGISISNYPEPLVEFGYGKPDCKVINYWDEGAPMEVSDPECKWLLLKRNGRLFIYFVTWNGDKNEVKTTLDLDALGVDVSEVVNAETGEEVTTLEDGAFTIEMPPFGVRSVMVE
ncbi:MAG: glycoside hydrolase domain-containing protein [Candidatus Brocadiia bacterium]